MSTSERETNREIFDLQASKNIIGGFILGLLLLSSCSNQVYQDHSTEIIPQIESNQPIVSASDTLYNITHENNFTQFGFTGSGSQESPYTLEGVNLTHTEGHIINVYNQSAFFEINSCEFHGSVPYYGVRIEKSTNGIIQNCTFDSSKIYCDYANGTLIQGCQIDTQSSGISILHSYFVTITKNTISDPGTGISLFNALNCTIHNNTIIGASTAIYDGSTSSFVTISDNIIINATSYGMKIDNSENYNITGNTLDGHCQYGIYIDTSNGFNYHISQNTICNFYDGIYCDILSEAHITNNTLFDIDMDAIYSYGLISSEISFNEIFDSNDGMSLNYLDGCNVTDNVVHTFTQNGIMMYGENCRVLNNRIHHGPIGIRNFLNSDSNIFYGNHLSNHTTNDAYDASSGTSSWDDGSGMGNYYNVSHSSPYSIPGGSGATDSYPAELVDSTSPIISGSADFAFDEDQSATVEWNGFDLHPWNYTIYLDGESVKSGYWVPSLPFTYQLENLSHGLYTLQLVVWDAFMNEQIDEVEVTVNEVDYVSPDISGPNDTEVEASTSLYPLVWTITEDYPDVIAYYLNDIMQIQESYSTSFNTELDISVLGDYNCTIVANDTFGNVAVDTVLINVIDSTAPTIDAKNTQFIEYGTLNPHVKFNLTADGNWDTPGSYTVLVNGTEEDSGSFTETADYGLYFNKNLGVYNVTFYLEDYSGNTVSATTIVTVGDTTDPTCSSISDFSITEGSTGHWMNWTCSDLLPHSYVIMLDNTTTLASGTWDGSNISYLLDDANLREGVYEITLTLYDTSGNSVTSSSTVNVNAQGSTTTTTGTPPPAPDMSVIMILAISGAGITLVVVLIYFLKVKK
ncbi:MAG: hypothetical protein GF411_19390 [Candidatus Lokiarchaeota archaeon]|nr:hypothetical protein [Candidatus Lokiarchaeota archaeon]